jgi:hypothetical protein
VSIEENYIDVGMWSGQVTQMRVGNGSQHQEIRQCYWNIVIEPTCTFFDIVCMMLGDTADGHTVTSRGIEEEGINYRTANKPALARSS